MNITKLKKSAAKNGDVNSGEVTSEGDEQWVIYQWSQVTPMIISLSIE